MATKNLEQLRLIYFWRWCVYQDTNDLDQWRVITQQIRDKIKAEWRCQDEDGSAY